MKKITSLCLMLGALISMAAFGQDANPGQNRLEGLAVSANVDYATKYIWRAIPQSDEAVLQPSIAATIDNIGPGKLGVQWWGNYNLTDANGTQAENRFTEYDWQIGYGMDLPGNSMVEIGMIYYYFPRNNASTEIQGAWKETVEFYANLEMGLVDTDSLDASFIASLYYDSDEVEGFYATMGVKGEYVITDKWAASLSTALGFGSENYNRAYFGTGNDDLNDVTVEAAIGAPIDDHISIKFGLGFSEILASDLERVVDSRPGVRSSNIWFKVGLHAKF
jgi:hypothetical protein